MFFGKVIGNIWATKKYPTLEGMKMLLLQPLTAALEEDGEPFTAIDTVGAGSDEVVLYVTASEATIPLLVDHAPVDASVVAIVDSIYHNQVNTKII